MEEGWEKGWGEGGGEGRRIKRFGKRGQGGGEYGKGKDVEKLQRLISNYNIW